MSAKPTAADQPFTIVLDDDETSVAEGRLRRIEAGPTWAKHRVTLEIDEGDTSGHALDATAVSVNLHFDDDVEGHALSLHFPTAAKADEFRRRLLATGIVAGALVVGVTAAQLSGTAPATNTVPLGAPVAVPGPRLPSSHIQSNPAPAVPGTISGPRLPSSHIQSNPAPSTKTPAPRNRAQPQ